MKSTQYDASPDFGPRTTQSTMGWQRRAATGGLWLATTACLTLLLVGCGTISPLKPAQAGDKLDFSTYSRVVVQDFGNKTTGPAQPAAPENQSSAMQQVCHDFADRVADEIEREQMFESVSRRGTAEKSTLLIGGYVTRYEEGDAGLRLWIGLGAGSSYFEALLEFRQGDTGELLGTIEVNKNSWVGGGVLAAEQTPEDFMREAAIRVAEEVRKAKITQ